mmetsp:Transcript_27241/g.83966  ORF Transcript_27241/g.83966 Transcript_27241/m.83966 type:complete len:291 (-) Transcript_27241:13-885(-)
MRALSLGLACCAFARAATPSNRGGGGTLARLALLKTRRPHLLPNLGYGACLSASLLQDELALRCVGMSAATFFFLQNIGNVLVPANSVNWKGAVMQTALVAGHFARTRQSVRTRLAVRRRDLSARELELYDLVFRDLQVTLRQYKAMLGAGARWGSDDVGVKLAREGRKHDRVLIILEGRCELSQSDVVVETLGPGNTVAVGGILGGEFLVRQTTATTSTPVKYVYWPREKLRQHFETSEATRFAVTSLLAHDEAKRLKAARVALRAASGLPPPVYYEEEVPVRTDEGET